MKKHTGIQVLTREKALSNAAYLIADVRQWLAELYGWTLSGGQDYIHVMTLAREIAERITRVAGLAIAFSSLDSFAEDVNAFVEAARLEAAQLIAWRESRQETEGEVA